MNKKKRILVVDDDAEDRMIINDIFTELGSQLLVNYCESGEGALQYLKNSYATAGLPDLVLLDLNMPRMNGTKLLHIIKSDPLLNRLRVIIYSTSLNDIEKEKCLLLGAEDYVIKPVEVNDLRKIVAHLLDVL